MSCNEQRTNPSHAGCGGVLVSVGNCPLWAGQAAGFYVGDGMSKKDESLKLALEALEMSHELADTGYTNFKKYALVTDKDIVAKLSTAITALREALAEQPEQQKPVAWLVECGGDSALVRHTEKFPGIFAGNEFTKRSLVFGDPSPPAQQQEPVGTYGEIFESMRSLLRSGKQADQQIYMAMRDKPLYTSPPTLSLAQRTWVWLSNEEEKQIKDNCTTVACVLKSVKAKLKEKNT